MAITDAGDESHPLPGKFGGNTLPSELVMLLWHTRVHQA